MEKNENPFFPRFLEGQEFPCVKSEIKAGPDIPVVTMKFPSDDDDHPVVIPFP